jgi:3-oxo-5alpha-steroid 4-dehydrogenase
MTEAPLRIDNPDSADWHDTADVIVVGFGGAGAAAAIEARRRGADVLAIDNFRGGGATAVSGGVNYAGRTRIQQEAGVEDSVEDMFNYLQAEGVPVKPETLRQFCEESSRNIEWLSDLGIPYRGTAYHEKCALPPDGYFLYYTGNEKHPRYTALARPAPRGHRVVTDGFGGHVHFARLREGALAVGVRFQPHAPVRRLVVDGWGTVIGVDIAPIPESAWAEHDRLYDRVRPWAPVSGVRAERAIAANARLESRFTERRLIRARNGVLLSAGGYIYNLGMLSNLRPELGRAYKALMRLGSMGCNGSGIRLGESVGGVFDYQDQVCVSRNIAPPQALVRGILVNARGERFVNEDVYVGDLGAACASEAAKPGNRLWLLVGARDFKEAFKAALNPGKNLFMMFGLPTLLNMFLGGTKRAGSFAAIARKCGIDHAGLLRTLDGYNAVAQSGAQDPLGKSPEYIHPFADGTCYALNMALENPFGFTMAFTLGGLRVEEESGAVVRADGSVIGGLYAAGRNAVGLCSMGYRQSGISIADTVFSGRRAGRAMAHR